VRRRAATGTQATGFTPAITFATSFLVFVGPNVPTPLTILGRTSMQLGNTTRIDLVASTNPMTMGQDLVQVSTCQANCDIPLVGSIGLKRGVWHLVEVEIASKTSLWVDGQFDTTAALTRVGASGLPINLGPAAGVLVDELRFYQAQ
jgi:hypothetical protein